MSHRLSIVIVNDQTEQHLVNCLRSLHVATKENIEVILVDPYAHSAAADILRHSGFASHYFSLTDEMHLHNFGASHAAGEFLCFLQPTMILGAHSLDELLNWTSQHARTVAAPRVFQVNGKIATNVFDLKLSSAGRRSAWSWQPWLSWFNHDDVFSDLCRTATRPEIVPALGFGCVVMPLEVWQDVGPWDEQSERMPVDRPWFHRAHDLGVVSWLIPAAEGSQQS